LPCRKSNIGADLRGAASSRGAAGALERGAEALLKGALGEEFRQVTRDVDAALFEFEQLDVLLTLARHRMTPMGGSSPGACSWRRSQLR